MDFNHFFDSFLRLNEELESIFENTNLAPNEFIGRLDQDDFFTRENKLTPRQMMLKNKNTNQSINSRPLQPGGSLEDNLGLFDNSSSKSHSFVQTFSRGPNVSDSWFVYT